MFETMKISKTARQWIISFIAPAVIMLIPANDLFTPELKLFLSMTIWAIVAFAFNLLNNLVTSIVLLFGYGVLGVCQLSVSLGVFLAEPVWITLCALILVVLIQKTTILERLAYTLVTRVGGSYMGIVIAVAVFSLGARLLLQGALAGVTALAVAYGICTSLGFGKSRASAGILITAAAVYLDSNYFLYSPDYISVAYATAGAITEVPVDFMSFLVDNIIYIIPLAVSVLAIGWFSRPKEALSNVDSFKEKLAELGPWQPADKKMLLILVALTVYLFTSRWHGMAMVYGFVFAVVIAFIPALKIGEAGDVAKVNWGAVFFVASCMSIGTVGAQVGFGTFISELALPYLTGMSEVPFMALSYALAILMNFIMTPAAILSLLPGPLAQICVDHGMSVQAMIHMVYQGGSQLIFAYEASLFMIAFSFGVMSTKDFAKLMGVKFVIQTIGTFTLGLMWWSMMGVI